MEDIRDMLDEILLKLNILCGKVDTLEAKMAINKTITPRTRSNETKISPVGDIRSQIRKTMATVEKRILSTQAQDPLFKNITRENTNVAEEIKKISE